MYPISGEYPPHPIKSQSDTDVRYSHTLNLTPLLPYMKALNPPPLTDKPTYQASDIPLSLSRNPLLESQGGKVTLLSFLIKGLLLAMEEHPIMRSRVKFGDKDEKWLEVGRDGVVGVAVSGT
jgi:2-oxoisovalerate dehydrogenase E2 component (dihydrolipoyl transacylase)